MAEEIDKKEPDTKTENTTPPAKPDEGLPKTQAELDALIQQRLDRDRKQRDKTTAGQPTGDPAQPAPASDDNAVQEVQKSLAEAQAQLAAYKEGVRPDAVEDAVLLAMHEVEKAGNALETAAIAEALKAVVKRHPEWKPEEDKKKQTTGFRVGATDPQTQPNSEDALSSVFGNKK